MKTFSIEAKNVSRSFGRRQVVRDLDLRIPRGSIYGLLGRNGAGKTTVIKMLAGLTFPDAGEIKVNGIAPAQFTAADRAKIGYVSERQILMPNLSLLAAMIILGCLRINIYLESFIVFARHPALCTAGVLALICVVQFMSERNLRKLDFP